MIRFGTEQARRRPNLTPMIDVVFLLLVFFMLVSRFGLDLAVPLSVAGGGGEAYSGPPRLIDLRADGLLLNGAPVTLEGLAPALRPLSDRPDDAVILRAGPDVNLQEMVHLMRHLDAAGFTKLVVVE